jgi:hypothetical protein
MTLVPPIPERDGPSFSPQPGVLNRRFLLAGAAGAGLATAGYLSLVNAQEEATPGAAANATPDAIEATGTETIDDASRVTDRIDAIRDRIDSVRADRDAVAAGIDPAQIDTFLGQATALLDAAGAALESGTIAPAQRYAEAGGRMAGAARGLIVAQLTFPGLPSQEASTSVLLADAHERLTAVTASAEASTTTDVTIQIEPAQELYATAYDQYGSGAYNQAAATGRVVQILASAAGILLETDDATSGGGPGGRGGFDRDDPAGAGRNRDGAASDEPVTVPEPDF